MASDGAVKIAHAPIVKIPIDALKFDTSNIRLTHLDYEKTQDDVEKKIHEIGDIEELVEQIVAAKTVFEPLVVDSNHVVLEGNRRLAACREILRRIDNGKYSFLSKNDFSNIRCKTIPRGTDPDSITIYLISLHIRSKKNWQLFNRAKYIDMMHSKYHWTVEEIAKQGFMSKSTVIKTLKSYEQTMYYKKFFGDKDKEWSKKYSYFLQLNTTKNLETFRSIPSNISKYHKWVFGKKFHNYHDVRQLNKIISNKTAYRVFINTPSYDDEKSPGTSFDNGMDIVTETDPGLTDKDFKILKNAILVIENFTRSDVGKIRNDAPKLNYIKKLQKESSILLSELADA